ncbi:hypothetical protein A1Q2_01227 [Trichosporon asahii var. asahii CBS 8904]|uniref:Uncharacterized protein n=1 Tax=Trichosporon asahii var. asahii (strain CBS 8904) TaxID=1220162 RepID=K1VV79_TRIAC|nr:hypothetical protein A1Q2_01227 [Trichosporon asahii var. asahii CBS 8904]
MLYPPHSSHGLHASADAVIKVRARLLLAHLVIVEQLLRLLFLVIAVGKELPAALIQQLLFTSTAVHARLGELEEGRGLLEHAEADADAALVAGGAGCVGPGVGRDARAGGAAQSQRGARVALARPDLGHALEHAPEDGGGWCQLPTKNIRAWMAVPAVLTDEGAVEDAIGDVGRVDGDEVGQTRHEEEVRPVRVLELHAVTRRAAGALLVVGQEDAALADAKPELALAVVS